MIERIPLDILNNINMTFVVISIISFVVIVVALVSLFFAKNKRAVAKYIFIATVVLFISFTGCVQTLRMNFS
jgi:hypothetical protein